MAHRVLGNARMQVGDYLRGMRANTAALPTPVRNQADLRRYFEYSASGVEVVEDGLKEISFGEFLVEQGVLDRYQLFRALQMQDRLPGVRLGECAAALGYAPIGKIERMFSEFAKVATVTVD
nr:hypothetical protein [Kofleriaceae bacterium]